MDYKSCHYEVSLNSLPLGLIKLKTYLSILGKTLFFTFKNQWEGESVRSVVSTHCCLLHGEYNHLGWTPYLVSRIFQELPNSALGPKSAILTSHISGGEAPTNLKLIANNALFQSNLELKLQLWYSNNSEVLIMRKSAFSAKMEVCLLSRISITIEVRDSNKKPICSLWYGLQIMWFQGFTQFTSSRCN